MSEIKIGRIVVSLIAIRGAQFGSIQVYLLYDKILLLKCKCKIITKISTIDFTSCSLQFCFFGQGGIFSRIPWHFESIKIQDAAQSKYPGGRHLAF